MDKIAKVNVAKILKRIGTYGAGGALAGGTALGTIGYKKGRSSGAETMGNIMATQFTEANAKENAALTQNLAKRFSTFNDQENAALASSYFKRGLAVGMRLGPKQSGNLQKVSSSEAYDIIKEAAFNDELEKLGFPTGAIFKGVQSAGRVLGGQFKNLGAGVRSAYRAAKASRGFGGSLQHQMATAGQVFKPVLRQNQLATGVAAGAAGTAGLGMINPFNARRQ